MTQEKIQTLVLRLNWTNIITTLGMCLPILIFQATNHKELMSNISSLKDSVLLDHANFINHEISDGATHENINKRLDKNEGNIFLLAQQKR